LSKPYIYGFYNILKRTPRYSKFNKQLNNLLKYQQQNLFFVICPPWGDKQVLYRNCYKRKLNCKKHKQKQLEACSISKSVFSIVAFSLINKKTGILFVKFFAGYDKETNCQHDHILYNHQNSMYPNLT